MAEQEWEYCGNSKCDRKLINLLKERRVRWFRGQVWHTRCLVKAGIELLGSMFYQDMGMLRQLRGFDSRNWSGFGRLLMEGYRRVLAGAVVRPESKQFVFDLLREHFREELEASFAQDGSENVVPLIQRAATEKE